MEYIKFFIDFVLHIDKHLFEIVSNYDTWTYLILFAIVFCETGFVVTPFLPGDSLLFAAGAIAATGALNVAFLIPILFIAAFGGDNTNYFIGNFIGEKVFTKDYRYIKKEYLYKTQAFYEKHGGKTVVIARFIPIIRTFAPFVAGIGSMKYPRFILFSLLGNALWINLFVWTGFFFGNIPLVKQNFSIVIIAIIFISIVPIIVGYIKHKTKR